MVGTDNSPEVIGMRSPNGTHGVRTQTQLHLSQTPFKAVKSELREAFRNKKVEEFFCFTTIEPLVYPVKIVETT
jgi:hypothetical protein